MINHVRTLLLNQNDFTAGQASGNPGAQPIDTAFQPVLVPQPLHDVRDVIIPPGYTPYQQNMTLVSVMKLLHAPELEPYTLLLDSRVTYALTRDPADQAATALDITRHQDDVCDLSLNYGYVSDAAWTAPGQLFNWTIRRDPDSTSHILVEYNGTATRHTPVFTNGISQQLPLIPGYLVFTLNAPTNALTGTFKYDIVFQAPVTTDLSALPARFQHLDLRAAVTRSVFEAWVPYTQELNELREIWAQSPEVLLRTGAFILGYAYQCERLRLR